MNRLAFIKFFLLTYVCLNNCEELCMIDKRDECEGNQETSRASFRYVLYVVNPSEGFNLRRDVFMRFAVFVKKLNAESKDYWYLVLPPWDHLYHWRSREIDQNFIPWSHFFDVNSIRRFAPVIELNEFLEDVGNNIDNVYQLQHFKGAFSKDWKWDDRWKVEDCKDDPEWKKTEKYSKNLWGEKMTSDAVQCVSFQGGASLLKEILETNKSMTSLFHHGEIVLHDHFGDKTYWECRRSMRFSSNLVREATKFRKDFLKSDDSLDRTLKADKWETNTESVALGGPFLCVHLRRQDFLLGRTDQIPSIEYAAEQIKRKLKELNLNILFLSSDAPDNEILQLKNLLEDFSVVQYKPDDKSKIKFKDGGVAIIDQIICSHARYFIGTHESTFSFRIQEEREILGFPSATTFNRLCGEDKSCSEPSKWTIVK